MAPEHAVETFPSIPGAQLCMVPPAGHGVMPKETVLTFAPRDAGTIHTTKKKPLFPAAS